MQERCRASLPGDQWREYWELLLGGAFHELFGLLALRDLGRARTKAALLSIGKPATRDEIAELCGVRPAQVGSYLSSFPSVVRADASRWGLSEWVDDEQEGIVGEIIQRIEEDGGVTTTERLIDEIPRKFGVSAAIVQVYLQTPKFVVRDGRVTGADALTVRLRAFEEVIRGRDERGGAAYRTFIAQ